MTAEVVKPSVGNPLDEHRHHNRRTRSRFKLFIAALLAIIVCLLIALSRKSSVDKSAFFKAVKPNQYQAVSLTNGQVYFGKIEQITAEGYILTDIYYLQVPNGQDPQKQPAKNQNFTLSKLGSEPHGPEDKMYIESRQVLLWENLKDDSQVVKAIQADKK
jgi:hypothetical protein